MGIAHYVLGFLFNRTMTEVALVRKAKPAWQAGFLNGIGGTVEDNETPFQAMVREFKEETGIYVPVWEAFALMRREGGCPSFVCHCYRCVCPHASLRELPWKAEDGQPVLIVDCPTLYREKALSNVPWLVLMASDLNPGDSNPYEISGIVGSSHYTKDDAQSTGQPVHQ